MSDTIDPKLALEAKALVALAFRNGPIEDVHAGKDCPTCHGQAEYSRISDDEMKGIMKAAVNQLYKLLRQKQTDAPAYEMSLSHGSRYTRHWDDPAV